MKTVFHSILLGVMCAQSLSAQEADLKLAVPQALEDAGHLDLPVLGVRDGRAAQGVP